MVVLHLAWLPQSSASPAQLALWGESGQVPGAPGDNRKDMHPFSTPPLALKEVLPLSELQAPAEETTLVIRLPTVGKVPQPSRASLLKSSQAGKLGLRAWSVPALLFTPGEALTWRH